jgi:hypothetical protein
MPEASDSLVFQAATALLGTLIGIQIKIQGVDLNQPACESALEMTFHQSLLSSPLIKGGGQVGVMVRPPWCRGENTPIQTFPHRGGRLLRVVGNSL